MATDQEGLFQGTFVNEVKNMMYTFGDIKIPCTESAILIDNITVKMLRGIIRSANEISRNDQNVTITDILFLFRNDKAKLKRIVKHIELRDICKRTSLAEDEDTGTIKKEQYSLSFLSQADMDDILSDNVDEIQQKRLENFDSITQGMNLSEYKEFSESRQVNFHKNLVKFKEWIDMTIIPLCQNTYNVLGYIAYDIVQEIVELAILIKHDHEGLVFDSTSNDTPPVSPNSPIVGDNSPIPKPKLRKRGRPPKNSSSDHVTTPIITTAGLQPFHILEALRRYNMKLIGPCVPMKTYYSRPVYLS